MSDELDPLVADETNVSVVNGLNGSTGKYALPPLSAADLSRLARGLEIESDHIRDLERKEEDSAVSFAPLPGIDESNLAQTGWGVIFAFGSDPAVKEALCPLLALREKQSNAKQSLFRVLEGPNGYRSDESKDQYLSRLPHSIGGGKGVAQGRATRRRSHTTC